MDLEPAVGVAPAVSVRLAEIEDRVMEHLAASPGAVCAERGEHRELTSWDREDSAERRRQARRRSAQVSPDSSDPTVRGTTDERHGVR